MEEKEKVVSAEKLSYEKLEQAAMQLQQRLMIAENRLRSIDYAAMRLNYMFKVLELKDTLPTEFVEKCSKEVVELLTIDEPSNDSDSTDEQAGEVD